MFLPLLLWLLFLSCTAPFENQPEKTSQEVAKECHPCQTQEMAIAEIRPLGTTVVSLGLAKLVLGGPIHCELVDQEHDTFLKKRSEILSFCGF